MQLLGENYPKSIYGMGNFEFEQTWQKSQKGIGAKMQNDHAPIIRGVKCINAPHHADQWVKTPQNIYNMPLVEKELKIQFEFEFKFKLNLNRKRKTQKEKEKEIRGQTRP